MTDLKGRALGGAARAAKLTPEERKEIAKKAAEQRWAPTTPKEEYTGSIKIGDRELPCAVLSNGQRVLSASGINRAFTGSISSGGRLEKIGSHNIPRFLASKSIKSCISNELMAAISAPIEYKPIHGGRTAYGYEASLLPKICGLILDAQKQDDFKNSELALVAELLIRGFAEIGIVALVDEATGYQEVRQKDALQAILDAYLRKELAAWAKRFPDEFYQQIFRLRNWQWKGRKTNPPQVVATYTKDIVYMRLTENILKELEKKNPADEKGNRKAKHHQWLTDEVGHPALAQHIYAVISLMRASSTWDQFKTMLDMAHPKKGENLLLPFMADVPSVKE